MTQHGRERRKGKRILLLDSSAFIEPIGEKGHHILTTICDLSPQGLGAVTRDTNIKTGVRVRFDFAAPKRKGTRITGTGRIVWTAATTDIFGDDLMRCGIRFDSLSYESNTTISHLVKNMPSDTMIAL